MAKALEAGIGDESFFEQRHWLGIEARGEDMQSPLGSNQSKGQSVDVILIAKCPPKYYANPANGAKKGENLCNKCGKKQLHFVPIYGYFTVLWTKCCISVDLWTFWEYPKTTFAGVF